MSELMRCDVPVHTGSPPSCCQHRIDGVRRDWSADRLTEQVGGPEMLGDLALPVLVPGPGTANLAISNSAMLPSGRIPVGDPQGRHIRRRWHARNQVVRIG